MTNAAQQARTSRSKSSFVPSHRKFRPAAPYTNYKINHAMIVGDFMTARYVLADVATKAAYFSLVAATFIFFSMFLLTGLHPQSRSAGGAAAFRRGGFGMVHVTLPDKYKITAGQKLERPAHATDALRYRLA